MVDILAATVTTDTHDRVTRRKRAPAPQKTRTELANEFAAIPLDGLATTAQVAAFLNCSEAKLERDRWAGDGIPFVKDRRSVRYIKRVVLEHVEASSRTSTSQAA